MTSQEILKADLLDILFEHRNKLYGAYTLRKEYHHRLGTALGIAFSILLLFVLMTAFRKNKTGATHPLNNDGVTVSIIEIPEAKPKPPEKSPQPPRPPQSARVDYQPTIIVEDHLADKILPDIHTLSLSVISNNHTSGSNDSGIAHTGDGTGENNTTNIPEPAPPVFAPMEKAALFPGGESAWLSFLRKYLQTPDGLEAGERKEVRIRFWIDTDGTISKFEIVQSGGRAFDQEVMRVMKKMPRWEPAEQNGRKVPVAFTQPVIFVGVEE